VDFFILFFHLQLSFYDRGTVYAKMVAEATQISVDINSWHEQVCRSHNLPDPTPFISTLLPSTG